MDGFSKDFEFSNPGSDLDGADSVIINTRILNDIPFDGTLDLNFKNESGETIYTLTDIAIIESPSIGTDGRTTEKLESTASIKLEDEGVEAFLNAEDIVATINIFTFQQDQGTTVKIFSDYELDIFLTAEGRLEVQL